jgi:D-alanyl-D-alanine-carboxypeptidase/D-alanyl-D-alanine-endopeptidase
MNKKDAGPRTKGSMSIPTDAEIRKILAERIDVQHKGVGIAAGVIDINGRRVIAYGHPGKGDPRLINGDTVFEIGSITKVFTSLLLADMVRRGEVSLDDPVASYLPSTVKMPERNGHAITMIDLATHTSGLPRLPGNINPRNIHNPYADYTVELLYQCLSSYTLTRDIGSQFEYSNLGAGLLGHVLTRKADMDYESLVYSRICVPLGMNDTLITLTPEMKARLATGHNDELNPVENFGTLSLAGAGALRSTVNDMLIFLAAYLGFVKSPLAPAMAAQLKVRRPAEAGTEIGLGLMFVRAKNGKGLIWHNGGTGGYRSWAGFDAGNRAGVVVLANAAWLVDDIGIHLFDAGFPLVKQHTEVKADIRLYDFYVGKYNIRPGFVLTVSREGDRLFTQVTGQDKFEIFPESNRDFFLKVFDSQITFISGDEGSATELVIHQGGMDHHAKRME